MYKLFRRGSGRMLILCVVVLSLLVCLYYVSQIQAPSTGQAPALLAAPVGVRYEQRQPLTTLVPDYSEQPDARVSAGNCPLTQPRNADIDTLTEYSKFDFQIEEDSGINCRNKCCV
ncbi:hypothetical protein KQX54_017548 [Cotesia glomerata]|uniref:Uncharacterized protein n=1 Tax=Cotesia glomerata TaxID=32391 RepID=A0AAV7ICV0_COTGL|nr:hypothetical protein KQX54_017548 [Cotesia glomerata]